MKPGDVVTLVKETVRQFGEDKATRLAAALAFAAVFSIPPLILLVLLVLGRLLGAQFTEEQIEAHLLDQFAGLLGPQSSDVLASVIENASRPGGGLIAGTIGLVALAIGASGFFAQLQDALNTIWEVQPAPGRGILGTIKDRLFSFSLVAGLGMLLLLSLIVSTALSALNAYIAGLLPDTRILVQILNQAISLVVIIVLFAAVYKIIPDVQIAWRDVWIGAIVTGILFTIGKWAIGLYIGQSSTASDYGAAGSLAVFLIWIYYSALIFFLGAEFTQVYANRFGTRLVPEEGAVPVTEEARAEQGMAPRRPAGHLLAGMNAPLSITPSPFCL
ncbi:MAG: YihY/virulence factor BrkB family protein [Chloroflexi bacterium]|jgi:membrane protein|nr:YihY/virulence factor BrkB family protein [Chloroflexota bacterium]